MTTAKLPSNSHPASLLRRLGAIVYDTLLLFAILFIAIALVLPLNGGQAVPAGNPWFSAYLFLVGFIFYGGFWTHGGQTLGMRAWRIRLQRYDGGPVNWWQALARFTLASLWLLPMIYLRKILGASFGVSLTAGLGCLLLLLSLRLHDHYSETVLMYVPPR